MKMLGIPSFDLLSKACVQTKLGVAAYEPRHAGGTRLCGHFVKWKFTEGDTMHSLNVLPAWIKRHRWCSTPRGGYLFNNTDSESLAADNIDQYFWPTKKDVLSRKILNVVIACLSGGRLSFFCNCKGERKFINISVTFGKMSPQEANYPRNRSDVYNYPYGARNEITHFIANRRQQTKNSYQLNIVLVVKRMFLSRLMSRIFIWS